MKFTGFGYKVSFLPSISANVYKANNKWSFPECVKSSQILNGLTLKEGLEICYDWEVMRGADF